MRPHHGIHAALDTALQWPHSASTARTVLRRPPHLCTAPEPCAASPEEAASTLCLSLASDGSRSEDLEGGRRHTLHVLSPDAVHTSRW